LRSAGGALLADAKFIVIQWDRSDGKPSRLLYGKDCAGLFEGKYLYPLVLDGGFQIAGSVATLEQAISSLIPGGVNGTLIVTAH
jgi:hypothetical protein